MKNKGLFICLLGLVLLSGCLAPAYSIEMWLKDVYQYLSYDGEAVMVYWQELLGTSNLHQSLDCKSAVLILSDVLDMSEKDLVGLGFFSQKDIDDHRKIDKKEAQELLEKAKSDLSQRTFLDTMTHLELNQPIEKKVDSISELTSQKAGLYEVGGEYYEVKESGEAQLLSLDEVVENLEIQTTFQPNLSETVIFPENTVFETNLDDLAFRQKNQVSFMKSSYFHFNIGDYRVNGRIYGSGLEINLKNSDFHHMTLENQLSLSQFKVTADVSLNPFKDPKFLLRADYVINDTLSLQRQKDISLTQTLLQQEMFAKLKERISSLVQIEPTATKEIELLRFSFPVPGTLESLKVDAVLKMGLLLNGEVELRFETSQHQGFQANHGYSNQIQENKWSVEPYLDGSCEFACMIMMEMKLGKYLIADASISSGVGAEGNASVYYVNTKEKTVDRQDVKTSLKKIEETLEEYEMNQESFIDTCADIDVYWFVRLGIGNSKNSLLKKCGLSNSFTPLKNHLKLLHIENHRVLDHCTRVYDFIDENEVDNHFQISSYQLIMRPGETKQLEADVRVARWESSDSKIVAVVDGKVTAYQEGTVKITAIDEKGNQSVCIVIVLEEDKVPFTPLSSFPSDFSFLLLSDI